MNENEIWIDEAIEKIHKKLNWVSDKNKNNIPYTTGEDGSYKKCSESSTALGWWTNGFWGGLLWLMYQGTNDDKYVEYANILEEKLEKTLNDFYWLHHDNGFMFLLTAVVNWNLTANKKSRKIGLHAANLLAGRFNPAGNFIRAWNDQWEVTDSTLIPDENKVRGWAIIDCMMNTSLLYWASKETKDPRFYNIARLHADTTIKHFIRPDGSVKHIVEFDPGTGEYLRNHAGQGYDENSTWSRGQGWALYGFINNYAHTGKQEYLNIAKKLAKYCMDNIGNNGTIPLDFRQPAIPAWEDSCGACIIASGLLEISKHVSEREKESYTSCAMKILKNIYEQRTNWSKDCDAIVQNCSSAYHEKDGHHMTMVYADFFFLEALYKLKNTDIYFW